MKENNGKSTNWSISGENQEIGELLRELIAANASVEIFEIPGAFKVAVRSRELERFPVGINFEARNINEALGFAVDWKRAKLGQPSLAEELTSMLEADEKHAAAPPKGLGPDACCGCGSRKPLILERRLVCGVDWRNGRICDIEKSDADSFVVPRPGEIGRCPDCGNHYTFGA